MPSMKLTTAALAAVLSTVSAVHLTLNDYTVLKDAIYNPPACGISYQHLDVNKITALAGISGNYDTNCGSCVKVCGSAGCDHLLVVDSCVGPDHIDISTTAGPSIVGSDTGNHDVTVTPADASNCQGIWSGDGMDAVPGAPDTWMKLLNGGGSPTPEDAAPSAQAASSAPAPAAAPSSSAAPAAAPTPDPVPVPAVSSAAPAPRPSTLKTLPAPSPTAAEFHPKPESSIITLPEDCTSTPLASYGTPVASPHPSAANPGGAFYESSAPHIPSPSAGGDGKPTAVQSPAPPAMFTGGAAARVGGTQLVAAGGVVAGVVALLF